MARLGLADEGDDIVVVLEIKLVAAFVDDDDDDDDVGPDTLASMAHFPFWQR